MGDISENMDHAKIYIRIVVFFPLHSSVNQWVNMVDWVSYVILSFWLSGLHSISVNMISYDVTGVTQGHLVSPMYPTKWYDENMIINEMTISKVTINEPSFKS